MSLYFFCRYVAPMLLVTIITWYLGIYVPADDQDPDSPHRED